MAHTNKKYKYLIIVIIYLFSQPTHYHTPHKLLLFLYLSPIMTASAQYIFKLNYRKDISTTY